MEFTKMNGLGNDFVVISGYSELPENVSQLAVKWCNRFFGIGADGLVFILPSDRADVQMRIINSDGTEAEQCGNAVRCVAKYVYDRDENKRAAITVETLGAGVQEVQVEGESGKASAIRVDMGEPVLRGLEVPSTIDADVVLNEPVEVDGVTFHFTAVSMGNPHCIIYVEDAPNFDLGEWGPKLEKHPLFPNRTNVEFVTVRSREYADMRVWERGAGPTLACGTGACATLVASVLNGHTERTAVISLKGGELGIEWNEGNNRVYMTGPAEEVYRGIISL
ncbi:diaminopimelate epimerase [Paenibacillus sp. FJAT-26967]|uniref:diaminopimelate epimerase n=1 Tax=Paenibacillus sp. FJAT-26967 TaxID=1729690 RepID=UPI000837FD29|nr:diaminopimelate epimerase [Paenibacillus sp. FJAT-26967]